MKLKTKAVTNKKIYDNYLKYDLVVSKKPNTILGSWIINHNFKGKKNNENLEIKGEYEINVWYSYDDDTKTDVITRKIEYNEIVPKIFNDKSTYHIKSLGNPKCNKTYIENDIIIVETFKQFEIEVIDEIEIKLEDKPEKIDDFVTECTCSELDFQMIDYLDEIKKTVNYLLEKSDKDE